jgi:hypothetical protein
MVDGHYRSDVGIQPTSSGLAVALQLQWQWSMLHAPVCMQHRPVFHTRLVWNLDNQHQPERRTRQHAGHLPPPLPQPDPPGHARYLKIPIVAHSKPTFRKNMKKHDNNSNSISIYIYMPVLILLIHILPSR